MMQDRQYKRLPRAEVKKAVERRYPCRVPLVLAHWWGEGLCDQYGERLQSLDCYPEDAFLIGLPKFELDKLGLSWSLPQAGAHDNRSVIDDWAKLDEFIAKLPDPERDHDFDQLVQRAKETHEQDIYLIVGWWGFFFGDRLGFWAGFDVQHTLREGTPADVRAEVRFLIDTFDRPEGGMCLAAGNGIVAGTPLENIEAFLDEAGRYGEHHRRQDEIPKSK